MPAILLSLAIVLPGVVLTPGVAIADNQYNGERLLQATKVGTETEYQCQCIMARPTGLEPVTHSLEGCCSIHLS